MFSDHNHPQNVLVVAPHPDDEVLGCGATMAKHAHSGDDVHVVVVTRGISELFAPETVVRVRAESARAHEMLGVRSVRYLEFPAPKLDSVPGYLLADSIRTAILELKPDIIYLPHRGDIHNDHKVVFLATCVACRPGPQMSVGKLLCYETPSETEWGALSTADAFTPTVFVDVTEFIDRKLDASECFESQIKPAPHPRSRAGLDALARLRGATVHTQAAEAFVLIREVIG